MVATSDSTFVYYLWNGLGCLAVWQEFWKHKLRPKVSPNKTVEGLVGGMLSAGLLGGVTYHLIFGEFYISQFFVFCHHSLLGAISNSNLIAWRLFDTFLSCFASELSELSF